MPGTDDFDVVVVGAGMAGVCCAGELVLQGLRPLLICESKEVAYQYRSKMIGNNRCLLTHPTRQVAWGGGWWCNLVRQLNVPVEMHPSFSSMKLYVAGTGEIHSAPTCPSAAAVADILPKLSPIPLDDETRANLEEVLVKGLAIPWQELVLMDRVPMVEWLEREGANEVTKLLLVSIGAACLELNRELAARHMSVFGCLGLIRSYLCGEADVWAIKPDAREGLAIPIAREVERRGGTVWRGRKAHRILAERGRAVGVVLEDGTEVRAPHVALACATRRVGSLLDPMPLEIAECLSYDAELAPYRSIEMFSLLDKPVDPEARTVTLVLNPDGSYLQAIWPISGVAPWTVEPGRYLFGSERVLSDEEVATAGGLEGVARDMLDVNEEVFPGWKDALVDSHVVHQFQWAGPFTVGPKLPRKVESMQGLWCVGEGSVPVGGVYVDGSSSAGILGARAIAQAQ